MSPDGGEITLVLQRWRDDPSAAAGELTPLVYSEMRKIAAAYLSRERQGHTLQPTELIHEAWLRLVGRDLATLEDRSHFYGLCARLMRQILVDYARAHKAEKRGAGLRMTLKTGHQNVAAAHEFDVIAIHEALEKLAGENGRLARVVELRYFGGLQLEEIVEATALSLSTVRRSLLLGEAWLGRALAAE